MRLPSITKSERRRSKRHWFQGAIQVFTDNAHIDGLGIQLSSSGMYLFAIADLPLGADVKVAFIPPHSAQRIELCAVVRHRTVYLYGIEFLEDEETATSAATLGGILNQTTVASQ
jgi:PilZ domain